MEAFLVILFGVAAAYLAWRALFPHKREITIQTLKPVRILNSQGDNIPGLKVFHGDAQIANPYIITLVIGSTGRADVPSSAFGDGTVTVDVGAPVLAVRGETTPPLGTADSSLTLLPGLYKRGKNYQIQVITDGRPSETERIKAATVNSLIDVAVKVRDYKQPRKWPTVRETLQDLGKLVIAVIVIMALIYVAVLIDSVLGAGDAPEPTPMIVPSVTSGVPGTVIRIDGFHLADSSSYEIEAVSLHGTTGVAPVLARGEIEGESFTAFVAIPANLHASHLTLAVILDVAPSDTALVSTRYLDIAIDR